MSFTSDSQKKDTLNSQKFSKKTNKKKKNSQNSQNVQKSYVKSSKKNLKSPKKSQKSLRGKSLNWRTLNLCVLVIVSPVQQRI